MIYVCYTTDIVVFEIYAKRNKFQHYYHVNVGTTNISTNTGSNGFLWETRN